MLNYDFSSHFYVVCSCDQDVFTELYYFPTFHHPLNDGVYRWTDLTAMYVMAHDIKLPEDFIEHIMNFYNEGNVVEKLEYDWRSLDQEARNWSLKELS